MTVLQGIGASVGGGPANGVALVADPQEAVQRLLSLPAALPIVLVLESTPALGAEWAILRRAGGLVLAGSGLLCTALTVARELGLPVVAGLGEAIRGIGDGQRLRLDGTTGTVELLAAEEQTVEMAAQPRRTSERW